MIFRNHNNMLICCSRNISDYYQCWKQLCCTIFLWKLWYILFFRIHRWIESSKEQHLFEIETFWNIINVFTVTFDQFNASLMIKSIHLFQKEREKNLLNSIFRLIRLKSCCVSCQMWRGSKVTGVWQLLSDLWPLPHLCFCQTLKIKNPRKSSIKASSASWQHTGGFEWIIKD